MTKNNWIIVLSVLLVASASYAVYLYTLVHKTPPCYIGYKEIYKRGPYVMLQKDTLNKFSGGGERIERDRGVSMVEQFQNALPKPDDTTTVYVDFDFVQMMDYVGYLLGKANEEEKNPDNIGVRLFMAKKEDPMKRNGTTILGRNGVPVYQNTLVFAPRYPINTAKKAEFFSAGTDWMFFNQGSICPYCAVDPTGLEDLKK
jgi:hypothetical protein